MCRTNNVPSSHSTLFKPSYNKLPESKNILITFSNRQTTDTVDEFTSLPVPRLLITEDGAIETARSAIMASRKMAVYKR